MDKDTILNTFSVDQLYCHFLNLYELPKGNISSPFNEDKNPSFKVFPDGKFKCFSSGKQGDIFQLVAYLNNLDCGSDFNSILKIIAEDMGVIADRSLKNSQLDKKSHPKRLIATAPLQKEQRPSMEQIPFKVEVLNKDWETEEIEYWQKLGVPLKLLDKYHVSPVKNFSFFSSKKNKDIIYDVNGFLCFSYNVNGNSEIYIPHQPEKSKQKFFCNGLTQQDVFGLSQLEGNKTENLIICAGKKDALVAVANGFPAIAFRSETHLPELSQIQWLQKHCHNLLICYDNDKGGISGRNRIIEKYPAILPLQLPEDVNDLTDFFQIYNSGDLQTILGSSISKPSKLIETEELTTIFHIAEEYLNRNYDLRNNIISLDIEISEKGKSEYTSCNENSLWLELQKKSIKIPINALVAILKSDFVPDFNPLTSYFDNLPKWNGEVDYIKKFSEYVNLDATEDRHQFEYHFKKWCVRAVKCASIPDYFNKQAFIITDDGNGQNIGKSSWCRFLCPTELSNYLGEDLKDDKDSLILLCKNFLINLDELDALSRKEVNHLKSYFSKSQINERLPYDRKNSIIQRVASFIGSTNMTTFLQDETGSVRWLCFVVKDIDWKYRTEFNIDDLWSQAVALAMDPTFNETMTVEDIQENEKRNEKFQIISPERDMINKFFERPSNLDSGEFMTPTEMLNYINIYSSSGIRMSSVGIGKALKALNHKRQKNDGVYGYWVKKLPI